MNTPWSVEKRRYVTIEEERRDAQLLIHQLVAGVYADSVDFFPERQDSVEKILGVSLSVAASSSALPLLRILASSQRFFVFSPWELFLDFSRWVRSLVLRKSFASRVWTKHDVSIIWLRHFQLFSKRLLAKCHSQQAVIRMVNRSELGLPGMVLLNRLGECIGDLTVIIPKQEETKRHFWHNPLIYRLPPEIQPHFDRFIHAFDLACAKPRIDHLDIVINAYVVLLQRLMFYHAQYTKTAGDYLSSGSMNLENNNAILKCLQHIEIFQGCLLAMIKMTPILAELGSHVTLFRLEGLRLSGVFSYGTFSVHSVLYRDICSLCDRLVGSHGFSVSIDEDISLHLGHTGSFCDLLEEHLALFPVIHNHLQLILHKSRQHGDEIRTMASAHHEPAEDVMGLWVLHINRETLCAIRPLDDVSCFILGLFRGVLPPSECDQYLISGLIDRFYHLLQELTAPTVVFGLLPISHVYRRDVLSRIHSLLRWMRAYIDYHLASDHFSEAAGFILGFIRGCHHFPIRYFGGAFLQYLSLSFSESAFISLLNKVILSASSSGRLALREAMGDAMFLVDSVEMHAIEITDWSEFEKWQNSAHFLNASASYFRRIVLQDTEVVWQALFLGMTSEEIASSRLMKSLILECAPLSLELQILSPYLEMLVRQSQGRSEQRFYARESLLMISALFPSSYQPPILESFKTYLTESSTEIRDYGLMAMALSTTSLYPLAAYHWKSFWCNTLLESLKQYASSETRLFVVKLLTDDVLQVLAQTCLLLLCYDIPNARQLYAQLSSIVALDHHVLRSFAESIAKEIPSNRYSSSEKTLIHEALNTVSDQELKYWIDHYQDQSISETVVASPEFLDISDNEFTLQYLVTRLCYSQSPSRLSPHQSVDVDLEIQDEDILLQSSELFLEDVSMFHDALEKGLHDVIESKILEHPLFLNLLSEQHPLVFLKWVDVASHEANSFDAAQLKLHLPKNLTSSDLSDTAILRLLLSDPDSDSMEKISEIFFDTFTLEKQVAFLQLLGAQFGLLRPVLEATLLSVEKDPYRHRFYIRVLHHCLEILSSQPSLLERAAKQGLVTGIYDVMSRYKSQGGHTDLALGALLSLEILHASYAHELAKSTLLKLHNMFDPVLEHDEFRSFDVHLLKVLTHGVDSPRNSYIEDIISSLGKTFLIGWIYGLPEFDGLSVHETAYVIRILLTILDDDPGFILKLIATMDAARRLLSLILSLHDPYPDLARDLLLKSRLTSVESLSDFSMILSELSLHAFPEQILADFINRAPDHVRIWSGIYRELPELTLKLLSTQTSVSWNEMAWFSPTLPASLLREWAILFFDTPLFESFSVMVRATFPDNADFILAPITEFTRDTAPLLGVDDPMQKVILFQVGAAHAASPEPWHVVYVTRVFYRGLSSEALDPLIQEMLCHYRELTIQALQYDPALSIYVPHEPLNTPLSVEPVAQNEPALPETQGEIPNYDSFRGALHRREKDKLLLIFASGYHDVLVGFIQKFYDEEENSSTSLAWFLSVSIRLRNDTILAMWGDCMSHFLLTADHRWIFKTFTQILSTKGLSEDIDHDLVSQGYIENHWVTRYWKPGSSIWLSEHAENVTDVQLYLEQKWENWMFLIAHLPPRIFQKWLLFLFEDKTYIHARYQLLMTLQDLDPDSVLMTDHLSLLSPDMLGEILFVPEIPLTLKYAVIASLTDAHSMRSDHAFYSVLRFIFHHVAEPKTNMLLITSQELLLLAFCVDPMATLSVLAEQSDLTRSQVWVSMDSFESALALLQEARNSDRPLDLPLLLKEKSGLGILSAALGFDVPFGDYYKNVCRQMSDLLSTSDFPKRVMTQIERNRFMARPYLRCLSLGLLSDMPPPFATRLFLDLLSMASPLPFDASVIIEDVRLWFEAFLKRDFTTLYSPQFYYISDALFEDAQELNDIIFVVYV
jgi:hypothetical protein